MASTQPVPRINIFWETPDPWIFAHGTHIEVQIRETLDALLAEYITLWVERDFRHTSAQIHLGERKWRVVYDYPNCHVYDDCPQPTLADVFQGESFLNFRSRFGVVVNGIPYILNYATGQIAGRMDDDDN